MQLVPRQLLAHDRVGRGLRAHHACDRLVPRRIEGLADRRVALHARPLEHLQQLALDELDALDEARRSGRGPRGVERPVEVVEHRDEITEQRLVGILDELLALALGPPPRVLGVCERAEQAVVRLVALAPKLLDLRPARLGRLGRRRVVWSHGFLRRRIVPHT